MPGVDGLTVIREARRLKADIPVIIITGFSTEASAIEAVNLGVSGYLTNARPRMPSASNLPTTRNNLRETLRRKTRWLTLGGHCELRNGASGSNLQRGAARELGRHCNRSGRRLRRDGREWKGKHLQGNKPHGG